MSHYAKLAAVGIRVVAAFIFLFGAMGVVYTFGSAILGLYPYIELGRYIFSSVVYLLAGLLIFLLGNVIGRVVARGVE
jgi:hypothetical protein